MTKVRWGDLTEEQKDKLREIGELNGCAGKGSWIDPPDWIFTASCDQHDFNYWLGGSEEAREKADLQFYEAMLADANSMPWYSSWYYRWMAWIYYKAVSKYAGAFFEYTDRERTLEDLEELLEDV